MQRIFTKFHKVKMNPEFENIPQTKLPKEELLKAISDTKFFWNFSQGNKNLTLQKNYQKSFHNMKFPIKDVLINYL